MVQAILPSWPQTWNPDPSLLMLALIQSFSLKLGSPETDCLRESGGQMFLGEAFWRDTCKEAEEPGEGEADLQASRTSANLPGSAAQFLSPHINLSPALSHTCIC